MSSGSRAAVLLDACGPASAVAPASKTSDTKQVCILMVIPSPPILSVPPPVEKLLPAAYNSSSCLSLRAVAWYKEFLPVVWFCRKGASVVFPSKGDLDGLRDCRAVHRHKRHCVCGCLPGRLHSSAQG